MDSAILKMEVFALNREDDSAEKSNFYTLAIFAEVRDLKLLKRNKKRLFI